MCACERGFTKIVEVLLNAGADVHFQEKVCIYIYIILITMYISYNYYRYYIYYKYKN